MVLTRAQAATLLDGWLTEATGRPLPAGADAWSDVPDGPHAAEIRRLTGAGVIGGYPDATFRPSRAATRGQFATLMGRAYALAAGTALPHGPDAWSDDAASGHEPAIDRLTAVGVVQGYADGTFRPEAPVTRAHASTLLLRLLVVLEHS